MIMLADVWSHDKGERKSKTSLLKCCGSSVPGIALSQGIFVDVQEICWLSPSGNNVSGI